VITDDNLLGGIEKSLTSTPALDRSFKGCDTQMMLEAIKQNPGGLFFLKGALLWLEPGTRNPRRNIPIVDTEDFSPHLIVILDAVKHTDINECYDAFTYIIDDSLVSSTNSYSDDSYDSYEPYEPADREIIVTALIGSGVYRIFTRESYIESAENIA